MMGYLPLAPTPFLNTLRKLADVCDVYAASIVICNYQTDPLGLGLHLYPSRATPAQKGATDLEAREDNHQYGIEHLCCARGCPAKNRFWTPPVLWMVKRKIRWHDLRCFCWGPCGGAVKSFSAGKQMLVDSH
jgi:hypothetical protein